MELEKSVPEGRISQQDVSIVFDLVVYGGWYFDLLTLEEY